MSGKAGSIVVELLALTGSFETDTNRATKNAERRFKEMQKTASAAGDRMKNAFVGVFAGLSAGAVLTKFTQESIAAQNEQAQLAAALRSTGEAAGFGIDRLNAMAEGMALKSTFGAGDINTAQARLLSYTGVVGEQFPRALQAAIDMATRLGTDVPAAAEAVGKALDSPKDGLSALSKQGFRFTEDQKALVERLQETGRTAEAQSIVLTALESAYGGAAEAARNTFGGALAGLGEQLNSLMTGSDGSLDGATASINNLTKALADPKVATAFGTFTGWMADLASGAALGAANLIAFAAAKNKVELLSGNSKTAEQTSAFLLGQLEESTKRIELLDRAAKVDPSNPMRIKALDAERERWKRLAEQRQAATDALKPALVPGLDPTDFYSLDANGIKTFDAAGEAARAKARKEAEEARKRAGQQADARAKQEQEAAAAFIRSLNEQLILIGRVGEEEELRGKIAAGTVKFTSEAQKEEALGIARRIDATKALAEQQKLQAEFEAQLRAERMQAATESARSIDALVASNRAITEEIELIGLSEEAQRAIARARESSTIALKEEQLARLQNSLQTTAEMANLEEEIRLLKERRELGDRKVAALIGEKEVQDAKAFTTGLETDLKSAFQAAFNDSENPLQAFGKSLQSVIFNRASSALASALLDGTGGGGGGLFGLFKTAAGLIGGLSGSPAAPSGASFGDYSTLGTGGGGGGLGLKLKFSAGGYTGDGGKYAPAGIVHRGEYVINAESTRRVGRRFLDGLNGYASGGYVGAPPLAGGSGGRAVEVHNYGGAVIDVVQDDEERIKIIVDERMGHNLPGMMGREMARNNSPAQRSTQRAFNIQKKR